VEKAPGKLDRGRYCISLGCRQNKGIELVTARKEGGGLKKGEERDRRLKKGGGDAYGLTGEKVTRNPFQISRGRHRH